MSWVSEFLLRVPDVADERDRWPHETYHEDSVGHFYCTKFRNSSSDEETPFTTPTTP